MEKRRLLTVDVSHVSYPVVVDAILSAAHQRRSASVCLANAHMLIEAQFNATFRQILNQTWIVAPDGKPLSILMRWLYGEDQDQIAGPDLMPSILKRAEQEGIYVFFYGSTPEVLEKLAAKITQIYPKLLVAGMVSPPFRPPTEAENEAIAQTINISGAQIVLVALGCPKQEQWMFMQTQRIQAVMLGVGAAFPFFTGDLQRAPRWMQQAGLEWLYRLIQEPGRLWKRYFIGNTLFLILAGLQLARHKIAPTNRLHSL